ncbi:uncharacterized protein LOC141904456 [Tubulanus polymorphus]|uniref:uncharacterized protein LOC141904456 n=1 Tax=Tubulanus polymorphus TaxID=672921 RepID=UPI003DA31BF6
MNSKFQRVIWIMAALSAGFIFSFLVFGDKFPLTLLDPRQMTAQSKDLLHEGDTVDESVFARTRDMENKDLAQKLYDGVRVLCWVMTSPKNLPIKAVAVRDTWIKRCNIWLFISSEENNEFPTVKVKTSEGRQHLTAKTMGAFAYAYKHYLDKADWFLKADDDTYVIVENLRYMLAHHKPTTPVYFGHVFKPHVPQGYPSGGAAYVLSNEALRRLVEDGQKNDKCAKDFGSEDVAMGKCMQKLGVNLSLSIDILGRESFHPFNPGTHIHGGYPGWYRHYSKYGNKKGHDCCSEYSISFHYVSPKLMYTLDFLIYHLTPFGLTHKFNASLAKTLFRHNNQTAFVENIAQLPTNSKFLARTRDMENKDLAQKLYDGVRVLCWVMTSPTNLPTKATAVRDTWIKRCNIWLFISSEENNKFPTVKVNTSEGRQHLTAKTMGAFAYAYKHYRDKADWFLKADDDTYVIVENLRYMLAHHKPTTPVFFGHTFKTRVAQGYTSGGAAYVLSNEALRRLVEDGQKNDKCAKDFGAEDVAMGKCMQTLGVKLGLSIDTLGREAFHPFSPATHIHGGYPPWYLWFTKYGNKKGHDCCSEYSISFHYVSPKLMYTLDFLIYHLTPFGLTHKFNASLAKTLFRRNNQTAFVENIAQLPTRSVEPVKNTKITSDENKRSIESGNVNIEKK